jgi:acetate kinase
MNDHILTLNAGSSSVKFSLVEIGGAGLAMRATGEIDGLGGARAHLKAKDTDGKGLADRGLGEDEARDHKAALACLLAFLEEAFPAARVAAVGHRVVHGGARFDRPIVVDDAVLAALVGLEPLAPLHQPHNVAGVRAARAAFPQAPQIACFDTAFHRGHTFENEAYALPRALYDEGLRRYGFHGLSYDYVSRRFATLEPELGKGRVIVAHLGNGASICALRNGKSVASTMGFSTIDGLPMGTRSGQLDPGVLLYLIEARGYDSKALSDLLYKQSGLLGLSGLSNDMRDLEASPDPQAAQAIAYFAHRIRYEIGGLAACLGGLDALIFTAGIGEHSSRLRALVMDGLGWLGVTGDSQRNAAHAPRISADGSRVPVFVVPTNEELRIAELTEALYRTH